MPTYVQSHRIVPRVGARRRSSSSNMKRICNRMWAFVLPISTRTTTRGILPPLHNHSTHRTICKAATPTSTATPNSYPALSRRQAVQLLALLSASCLPNLPSGAATETGNEEVSKEYGYRFIAPPGNWTRSEATLSMSRSATVFLNADDNDSNINIVATPVPGDFTRLTSFGPLDNVLQTLVPQKGPDIDGEVLSTRTDTANNAYVIEYSITSKGEKRHLLTVFSLQPGRFLVTLTGQARDENWGNREKDIRKVVGTYKRFDIE